LHDFFVIVLDKAAAGVRVVARAAVRDGAGEQARAGEEAGVRILVPVPVETVSARSAGRRSRMSPVSAVWI
jgi:hypothetical protein